MRALPEIVQIEYILRGKPCWPDDCGHDIPCMFSITREMTDPLNSHVLVRKEEFDIHLHRDSTAGDEKAVCIRYGRDDKYISTYYRSFMVASVGFRRYDVYAVVHDMLWNIAVCNLTPKQAFTRIENNVRVRSEDL